MSRALLIVVAIVAASFFAIGSAGLLLAPDTTLHYNSPEEDALRNDLSQVDRERHAAKLAGDHEEARRLLERRKVIVAKISREIKK